MGHEIEWLSILLRWFHVIIAVMWIGASFYIISWENKFNRTDNLKQDIAGNFWTIQGGDFYYVEKLKKAPQQLPRQLHWFKYEAYFTWLSGFSLLCFVFYINTNSSLIASETANLTHSHGILIGLGTLVTSWCLYSLYCKTPLAKNYRLSALIGLVFLAILGYSLSTVFTQRATVIHMGAVIGTIMSANVFFVIIPWHKALIKAISEQHSLDSLYQNQPGFRSRHNHYMTLPVFFIMLSSHFSLALNQQHYWLVITALALFAGLIKHYHNLLQQQVKAYWYLFASITVLIGVVVATAPPVKDGSACTTPASSQQIFSLVSTHCRTCHSSQPTDQRWLSAPNGLSIDNLEQLNVNRDKIIQRVVISKDMPFNNESMMSEAQRLTFSCWQQSQHSSNRQQRS